MDKIPSFNKDHINMNTGFSVSMVDKDITTFDLRFIKPNCGKYLSYAAIHSIEHLLATILRNSGYKDKIIYFGPMGCRTGFYLLTRDLNFETVKKLLIDSLVTAESFDSVPGASENECGNYRQHSLISAKKYLRNYLKILQNHN